MKHEQMTHIDYGTGQKSLRTYIWGTLGCVVLTLVAFWAVMSHAFPRWEVLAIIYTAAILQFFIQLTCFLRLNLRTVQSRLNVMSFVFTGVILVTVVIGTLWIMHNLDYNMMH